MSFVDAMFNYLAVDPADGFRLIDAFELENSPIDPKTNTIITQVYDEFIASNVKIKLMDYYDDEQEVYIVNGAGIKGQEQKVSVKLYEIDRYRELFNYLTSLYIPKSTKKMYNTVYDLQSIMKVLRSPEGCEWDKKQTHETLKKSLIEEAYEVNQAIDNDDIDELIEELGDVLLQVVFHSQIGEEEGFFNLGDITSAICKKLIHRHPHVFKNENIDMNEFDKTWEDLKREEKGETTVTEGLKRIPAYLPALMKAQKIQKKAALVGFDWDNIEDVHKKVKEEYKELEEDKESIRNGEEKNAPNIPKKNSSELAKGAQYFSAKIMPILNRNQAEQINDLVAEYGADSFILACDRAVVDKNRSITHIANLLEKARRSRNSGQSVNVESILDELIERAGQS